MTYPFVPSYVRLGMAKGPRRAFLVHMAEGGGTVGFLAKANRYGVSVHFVIEYSGRIVQMLTLGEMHSSIRTSAIRATNDADRFFGATAAKAVMGDWARIDKTLGPNHASIAVEMEGFSATGPNPAQVTALGVLWADLRGRYPAIRSLGHRDFASYKACPGKLIPWSVVAGHGPAAQEVSMAFTIPPNPLVAVIPEGGWIYDNEACASSSGNTKIIPGPRRMPVAGKLANGNWIIGYVDATPTETQLPIFYAKAGTLVEPAVQAAPPPPPPVEIPPSEASCKTFIDAAITADRAKAHVAINYE